MAKTIKYDIEVDDANAVQSVDSVEDSFEQLNQTTDQNTQSTQASNRSLKDLINSTGLFNKELGIANRIKTVYNTGMSLFATNTNAGTAATGRLTKALQVLRIALISTGIGAIAVAVGTLAAGFLSTQRGADALRRTLTPLRFVLETILGLVQDLTTALLERDWSAAVNIFRNSGEAISEAHERGQEYTDTLVDIEEAEIALESATASRRREMSQLRTVVQDNTASEQERIDASERYIELVEEQAEEELDVARMRLRNHRREMQNNDDSREARLEEQRLLAEIEQIEEQAEDRRRRAARERRRIHSDDKEDLRDITELTRELSDEEEARRRELRRRAEDLVETDERQRIEQLAEDYEHVWAGFHDGVFQFRFENIRTMDAVKSSQEELVSFLDNVVSMRHSRFTEEAGQEMWDLAETYGVAVDDIREDFKWFEIEGDELIGNMPRPLGFLGDPETARERADQFRLEWVEATDQLKASFGEAQKEAERLQDNLTSRMMERFQEDLRTWEQEREVALLRQFESGRINREQYNQQQLKLEREFKGREKELLELFGQDTLDIEQEILEASVEQQEEATRAKERLLEQEVRNQQEAAQNVGRILQTASQAIEEHTTAGKALGIASALVDGGVAVQKALASAPPPFNYVAASAVAAQAALNVKRIKDVEVPGSRSSSSPSGSVEAPEESFNAPDVSPEGVNTVETIFGDQAMAALDRPAKAIVVETDITETQNRVREIEEASRF